MAEQGLDGKDVHAGLQQVRCEGVSLRVEADGGREPSEEPSAVEPVSDDVLAHGLARIDAWEEPGPLRPRLSPVLAERGERALGQRRDAVLGGPVEIGGFLSERTRSEIGSLGA